MYLDENSKSVIGQIRSLNKAAVEQYSVDSMQAYGYYPQKRKELSVLNTFLNYPEKLKEKKRSVAKERKRTIASLKEEIASKMWSVFQYKVARLSAEQQKFYIEKELMFWNKILEINLKNIESINFYEQSFQDAEKEFIAKFIKMVRFLKNTIEVPENLKNPFDIQVLSESRIYYLRRTCYDYKRGYYNDKMTQTRVINRLGKLKGIKKYLEQVQNYSIEPTETKAKQPLSLDELVKIVFTEKYQENWEDVVDLLTKTKVSFVVKPKKNELKWVFYNPKKRGLKGAAACFFIDLRKKGILVNKCVSENELYQFFECIGLNMTHRTIYDNLNLDLKYYTKNFKDELDDLVAEFMQKRK